MTEFSWGGCRTAAALALVAALAGGSFGAEAPGLDPVKALTQFGLDTWTTDHGLPNATVNAVLHSREGYFWLGTYDGLARFDGSRFVVFNQAHGLGNNGIRALCEDREGGLWIGTNGGGLSRLSAAGKFSRYTTADGLPSDVVWSLLTDRGDGSIWVGTNGGGLARVKNGKVERFPPEATGKVISSIAQADDGTLWLAAQAEGVRRRGPDGTLTAFTVGDGLPIGLVTGVALGRDGALWGGTSSGGVFRIREGRIAPLPDGLQALRHTNVSAVLEDPAGTLWIATNGAGLARWANGQLDFRGAADGVGEAVYALRQDLDGALWIGTNGAGVNRLRDGSFTAYAAREGLSRDFAYTTFEDSGGTLWVGSAGGLDRLERGRLVRDAPPTPAPVAVRSLAEAADGTLWVATYGAGVWQRRGGRWRGYSTRDGLGSDNVRAVLVDRSGRLWAATVAGLGVLEGERFRNHGLAEGLPLESLIGLAEDRDGALWIGTDGRGLVRLHEGRFRTFTTADGLASNLILALHVDSAGTLWAGTNGGLSRRSGERFVSFTSGAGLPSDAVTQLHDDASGNLWIGTSRGVARLSGPSLARGGELEVESFDRFDGMKSSQCTAPGQPAGLRSRDGRLWFATTQGVAVVDPGRLRRASRPPSVVVEAVHVDGVAVRLEDGVRVPPGPARIEFRYTVLSPLGAGPTAVRFRLDGFDADWLDGGDRRRADYTGVPPGAYVFRAQVRSGNGPWGEWAVEVPIQVTPHFYQTRAFLASAILAGLGLISFGHRYRTRRLHARERELTLLVEERTRGLADQKERAEREQAQTRILLAERERTQEELRRQGAYLASLHETALAVMDRLEVGALLQTVVERATELLGAPDGFVYLLSPDGTRLECRVWVGAQPRDKLAGPGEGAVGQAVQTGNPVVVDDYDAWPGRSRQVPPGTFGAMLSVPLRSGGRVRGALGVAHAAGSGRRFATPERELLSSFAQLASIALDNARLFERERAARETAERLQAATRALAATIDRRAVVDLILVELRRVVPADSASIQELKDGQLEVIAASGHAASYLGHRFDPASGDGRSREVLDGRRPVIREAAPYADGAFAEVPAAGQRSWLGVPLIFGQRVIGMLALNKAEPGFYTAELSELALAFAAQAAVAIENARLYGAAQDEIAARTRAHRQLARSEARHRDLFEHSLGLLCTHDLEGALLSVNPAAAQALGRTAVQLVGHRLQEFLPDDVRPRFATYLDRIRQDRAVSGTLEILDAQGERHLWRYRNVRRDSPDGAPYVIGFAQDVTEEEAIQHALRESEQRFRQLAENIDAAFFIRSLEPEGLLYVSPGFERIWGQHSTLDVAAFAATIHPDDREKLAAAHARQAEGYDVEYRIVRPDGELRWIRSRTFPVPDEDGRITRVAGIAEDVTSRKSVEQMREDLTHTLVHDLRGPLTAILASLELLEMSLPASATTEVEMVHLARSGGSRLLGMVDAILDVSRFEEGAMPLHREAVELASLVRESLEMQAPLARTRGLVLAQDVPDALRAWADRSLLLRVLQNLVGNAIKFTPQGGRVRVAARVLDGLLEVQVADEGPGIPEEVRPRLFEKFVTGRQRGSGSGLGLLFCRLAVEAHGGRIRAESRAGTGAVFTFTLPAAGD